MEGRLLLCALLAWDCHSKQGFQHTGGSVSAPLTPLHPQRFACRATSLFSCREPSNPAGTGLSSTHGCLSHPVLGADICLSVWPVSLPSGRIKASQMMCHPPKMRCPWAAPGSLSGGKLGSPACRAPLHLLLRVKAPHGAEPSGTGSSLETAAVLSRTLREVAGTALTSFRAVLLANRACGGQRRPHKRLRVDFAIKGSALATRGIDHSVIYAPAPPEGLRPAPRRC